MATYNKFDQFVKDVIDAKHNFGSDVFKVMLTNTAPVSTNTIKSNITDITAGNGYVAGGPVVTITEAIASGVAKVSGTNPVITATGAIGPFRYAVLYNDTQTAPVKPLVAWWDYGSALSLASGDTLTVQFDAVNGIFQLS